MSRLIDAEHFEQMLIDLIDNGDHKNAYVHHAYKMRDIAIKECRKMLWEEPTVDAVPVVHGHWIKIGGQYSIRNMKCSICGEEVFGDVDTEKYCFNCGAKMDEVTE